MQCKNYYLMSEAELIENAKKVREWLFRYPKHESRAKAIFAMEVMNSAYELKRDEFTILLIETLT